MQMGTKQLRRRPSVALAASTILWMVTGCSSEPETLGMPCERLGESGVALEALCDDDFCTAGVECSAVVEVESADGLAGAVGGASAGTCIALAPGRYGAVELPGGVHLLGRGANFVAVAGVTVLPGGTSVVRGVQVNGGVVVADGASGVSVEDACVVSSTTSGVRASAGSTVSVARSHIKDAAGYGVEAFDVTRLSLLETRITGAGAPGVWASCSDGCACSAQPEVDFQDVTVHEAALVGVALNGVNARLRDVSIADTGLRDFQGGGALAMGQCSVVDAEAVVLQVKSAGDLDAYGAFGLLSDGVSGRLGAAGSDRGIIIVGGRPGAWFMDREGRGAELQVNAIDVSSSTGVGIGVSAGARGIIIVGGRIADTLGDTVPLANGGADTVGDGLSWNEGAGLVIDGVSLSRSARQAVLIDGGVGAGSNILAIDLANDPSGILQQRVQVDDPAPELGSGVSLATESSVMFAVPAEPSAPAAVE
jgi:hypothetical protein